MDELVRLLGYSSYHEYIHSPHWAEFKNRYRGSVSSVACLVCGCKTVQLHHVSYANLGSEALEDVRPLCRDHHTVIHAWLACESLRVGCTDTAIVAVRKRLGIDKIANPPKRIRKEVEPDEAARNYIKAIIRGQHSRATKHIPYPEEAEF